MWFDTKAYVYKQEDNNGGEKHSKPRLQYTRNLISDQTTYLGNPTLGLKFFFDR